MVENEDGTSMLVKSQSTSPNINIRDSVKQRLMDDRRESCGFPLQLAYSRETNLYGESPRLSNAKRIESQKKVYVKESLSIN